MSFGGFLGIGRELPSSLLKHITKFDGYEVDLDDRVDQDAPKYDEDASANWDCGYRA